MTDMTQDDDARIDEMVRFTAKAMGSLLVARKDAKAVEKGDAWMPDREQMPRGVDPNTGALIPFKMGDFRQHLLGKRCLGTYLLNTDNMVKFFAFDIDLSPKPESIWLKIHDPQAFDDPEPVLDLEIHHGNLEAAMHVMGEPAYRWARTMVWNQVISLVGLVKSQLGLPVLPVITGGGAHVIVPLGDLMPAVEARSLARSVMDATGFEPFRGDAFWRNPSNPNSGIEIEVFPKQDRLPDSGSFGNLIRLPLGWHHAANIRTYFLDIEAPVSTPAWELPRASSSAVLRDALNFFGME